MAFPNGYPQRGEVYWVDLDPVVGSEQSGRRPALVVSPDSLNRTLPVAVTVAITSKVKVFNSPIAPVLEAGHPLPMQSQVLTFQIRTLDRSRLQSWAGVLTPTQMESVALGLITSFGLGPYAGPLSPR